MKNDRSRPTDGGTAPTENPFSTAQDTPSGMETHAAKVVADAPPLTVAQVDRLAAIIRAGGGLR